MEENSVSYSLFLCLKVMCSEFRVMVVDSWNSKFITEHSAIYILKYVVSSLRKQAHSGPFLGFSLGLVSDMCVHMCFYAERMKV
jgi:hypothetical protein